MTANWRETIISSPFIQAVEAEVRDISTRAAMVDIDGNEVASIPVTSGSVEFNGESSEQWTCSIVVNDPALVPTGPDSLLDPRSGLRLRIWWRILGTSGSWLEVPIGTFYLQDPKINDSAGSWSMTISGRDAIFEAGRGGYGASMIVVSGMTVTQALNALFERVAPQIPRNIAESTVTLPTPFELGARDAKEDWNDLASMAGLRIRADREGTITGLKAPAPTAIKAQLVEGPDCVISQLSREIVTSSMINRVVVRSTNTEIVPVIIGIAEDNNPGSSTWVGRFGPYETEIKSDAIATQAGADGMARATYERWRKPMESIDVVMLQRPDFDYRDNCHIVRKKSSVAGAYQVGQWKIPLVGADDDPQPMTVGFMTKEIQ